MFGAIGAGLGLVGGLLGANQAREGATAAGDAQKAAILQMIAKLDQVGMPPDQSAAVILDQYRQAGILTPALEAQVVQLGSEFKNIKTDQAVRGQQVQALRQMSQLGSVGMTADERALNRQQQADVQRDLEAKQQQIIQNLAARGQAGGGAEIAARLGASQGSAQQASESADRVSALAAQRALQAIMQSSNMAGQLREGDFSEESAKARAGDEMSRFNTQNQMAINQRNTASSNVAQTGNLENLQRIGDLNVGQANEEKYNQLARQRQFWNDKLRYAQAYAGPLQDFGQASANQARGESSARQKAIGEGFGGLSTIFGGLGGAGAASGASSRGEGGPGLIFTNDESDKIRRSQGNKF